MTRVLLDTFRLALWHGQPVPGGAHEHRVHSAERFDRVMGSNATMAVDQPVIDAGL